MVRCTPRRSQNGYAAADVASSSVLAVDLSGDRNFRRKVQQNPPLLWIGAAERFTVNRTILGAAPTRERHCVIPQMVIYELKPKDPCAEIDIFWAPPAGEPEGRLQVRDRYRHLQCPVCKKVDELAALDLGVDPDVRTRTRRDVIGTFCSNCIVSERFVRWAEASGVTGLRYIPMSDGHFVLRPTMLVAVDPARSQMDFRGKPPCRGCGRFRQTCGVPDPAAMELPTDPHAIFCPTLRPESHYSSHPLFLFAEPVAQELLASDLTGFWRDGDTWQYWATPGQPAAE